MPSEPDIVERLDIEDRNGGKGYQCHTVLRDAKAEITTLRARLTEVEKERDTARAVIKNCCENDAEIRQMLAAYIEESSEFVTPTGDAVEALLADARVLAAEVEATRRWVLSSPECRAARAATDASGALGRHGQKKEDNANAAG